MQVREPWFRSMLDGWFGYSSDSFATVEEWPTLRVSIMDEHDRLMAEGNTITMDGSHVSVKPPAYPDHD